MEPLLADLPRAIRRWQRTDPTLAKLARAHPPTNRTIGSGDLFGDLASSLVHQQVSIHAGRAIWTRLATACGGRVTPRALLALGPEKLRAAGVSRSKAAYLLDLAARAEDGRLNLEGLRGRADAEAIAQLTQVKGIGVWTAQMFLLFALARPDVVADGDLGLQIAVAKAYRVPRARAAGTLRRRAALWSPYGSLASLVLWQSKRDDAPKATRAASATRRNHQGTKARRSKRTPSP